MPYRDTVQAINDLAEGRVHAYVGAYAILRPQVQAGKVKVLALTNSKHGGRNCRISQTAAAAGFKSLTMDGLIGLFGPPRLSQAVRDRIAADHARGDRRSGDHGAAHADRPGGQSGHVGRIGRRHQRSARDGQRIGKTLGLKTAQ